MTALPTPRRALLVGGPLDGNRPYVWPVGGDNRGPTDPLTITLAYGCTDEEPWPHQWLDYHRQPDGTYRWVNTSREAS